MKKTVLVSWRTTPVSLRQSKDLQLDIQKRCSFLKNVAFLWILCFWFWFCYLTSIVDENSPWSSYFSFLCATSAVFLATPEVS